jgi:hypothetical protein
MHRIARDEHEITSLDSPDLVAYSEAALAFQDKNELLVVRLDVNDVFTFFENVDVAR